jgi:hypothetical protein
LFLPANKNSVLLSFPPLTDAKPKFSEILKPEVFVKFVHDKLQVSNKLEKSRQINSLILPKDSFTPPIIYNLLSINEVV